MGQQMQLGRKTANVFLLNSYTSIVIFFLFTKSEVSFFAISSTSYFAAGLAFYVYILTKSKSCGHGSLLHWRYGFFAPFIRKKCAVCGNNSLD